MGQDFLESVEEVFDRIREMPELHAITHRTARLTLVKRFPYLKGFKERASAPDTIEYIIGAIFDKIKNKFQSGYSLRDALELTDAFRFRSQKVACRHRCEVWPWVGVTGRMPACGK